MPCSVNSALFTRGCALTLFSWMCCIYVLGGLTFDAAAPLVSGPSEIGCPRAFARGGSLRPPRSGEAFPLLFVAALWPHPTRPGPGQVSTARDALCRFLFLVSADRRTLAGDSADLFAGIEPGGP